MLFDNVQNLVRRINSVSRASFQTAYTRSLPKFPLLGLANIQLIDAEETSHRYTPEERHIISMDASPSTCGSSANVVNMATGGELRVFANKHELAYEICIKDCVDKSQLDAMIRKKEEQVATGLLYILAMRFWQGNPSLLQYGITNHPTVKRVESTPTGKNGSRKWADKSNNEIMKELRVLMRYMSSPIVVMSEKAYEDSLGNADSCTENTCSDDLRAEKIERLLRKQPNVNFTDEIRFLKELDNHPHFGGENIALVYDKDALEIRSSGPIWLGAMPINEKVAKATRMINTSGLKVMLYDSVFIIIGI